MHRDSLDKDISSTEVIKDELHGKMFTNCEWKGIWRAVVHSGGRLERDGNVEILNFILPTVLAKILWLWKKTSQDTQTDRCAFGIFPKNVSFLESSVLHLFILHKLPLQVLITFHSCLSSILQLVLLNNTSQNTHMKDRSVRHPVSSLVFLICAMLQADGGVTHGARIVPLSEIRQLLWKQMSRSGTSGATNGACKYITKISWQTGLRLRLQMGHPN